MREFFETACIIVIIGGFGGLIMAMLVTASTKSPVLCQCIEVPQCTR